MLKNHSIIGSQRALLRRQGSQPKRLTPPLHVTILQTIVTTLQTIVTTLAGYIEAFADGTGAAARFSGPRGITADSLGNVYVADTGNHRIRKINAAGVVTTIAGSINGYLDGTGAAAQFSGPQGITADSLGNVYVADTGNQKIRKINAAGVVTTIAGSTLGFADGTGDAAQFDNFAGITIASDGNLYVADTGNNRIRKIVIATGVVTTLAGSATPGALDGTGTAAQFSGPQGITADSSGNLYLADTNNHRIRKINAAGVVTTLAGAMMGNLDGTGTAARFSGPRGLIPDSSGNLYVADTGNNRIRKIDTAGVVTTLAGSTSGYLDGTGTAAQFSGPHGIVVSSGNLYVTDRVNNRIRTITFN